MDDGVRKRKPSRARQRAAREYQRRHDCTYQQALQSIRPTNGSLFERRLFGLLQTHGRIFRNRHWNG